MQRAHEPSASELRLTAQREANTKLYATKGDRGRQLPGRPESEHRRHDHNDLRLPVLVAVEHIGKATGDRERG